MTKKLGRPTLKTPTRKVNFRWTLVAADWIERKRNWIERKAKGEAK